MGFGGGAEDELGRHAAHPLEDAGDFRRPGLLSIVRPVKGREREFEQAGIHCRNTGELFATADQERAVVGQDEQPGLNHLIEVARG